MAKDPQMINYLFGFMYILIVVFWLVIQNLVNDIEGNNFIKLGNGTYICNLVLNDGN